MEFSNFIVTSEDHLYKITHFEVINFPDPFNARDVRMKLCPSCCREITFTFYVRYRPSFLWRYPFDDCELLDHSRQQIIYFLEGDETIFSQQGDYLLVREQR